MLINRKFFIEQIADKTGLSKCKSEIVLKTIINEIKEIVENGHTIRFVGFGKFGSYIRSARRIGSLENGRTTKKIKARRLPRFWVSRTWKLSKFFKQD